jgi:DNA-binding GntR family transcriptional regulator
MTPARESVRRLVAEGALTLSNSGRVSTPELSNERIEELAALRALLETELASRALPRAHLALIERLTAINTTVSEAVARKPPFDPGSTPCWRRAGASAGRQNRCDQRAAHAGGLERFECVDHRRS